MNAALVVTPEMEGLGHAVRIERLPGGRWLDELAAIDDEAARAVATQYLEAMGARLKDPVRLAAIAKQKAEASWQRR